MNKLILTLLTVTLLMGCAGKNGGKYTPPTAAAVGDPLRKTRTAIEKAVDSVETSQNYQVIKKHLQEAHKQVTATEVELEKHQLQVEKQTEQLNLSIDERNKAETRADIKTKEAHQNAKERDVVIYVWSVFFALWLLATMGVITDALPPQYRIAGKVVFLFVGFGAGYGIGRYILRWLAYLFP
jgi:cation transport ATPase